MNLALKIKYRSVEHKSKNNGHKWQKKEKGKNIDKNKGKIKDKDKKFLEDRDKSKGKKIWKDK